ncbi:MAG: hypothetical protein EHM91_09760, partial [Planctomycetota bacterium]
MNDCRRYQDLIEEYLDGTLDESRLQELKAHAAACETCAEELRRSDVMREVIVDAFEPPTAAKDAAAQIVAKCPSRPCEVRVRSIHGRMALAAGILLAVGTIVGFALGRSGSVPPDELAVLTRALMRVAGLEG